MVFSSTLFLFYFLPFFLLFYYLTPSKYRNITLLLGSIAFYSWGGPVFIFVIFFTTLLDYILVRQIERSQTKKGKKLFLILSLCVNLGLLFSFKYLGFFVSNINALFYDKGAGIDVGEIILPIGISFYTFESLTYVIDVYRGEQRSLSRFGNYLTYILMFPKLIAGPIIPYNKIANQIEGERRITSEMRLAGLMRFILGLSKKVLVANLLGATVSKLYLLPEQEIDMTLAWAMSVGYTMQLYFDFSGYCDMAVGISKMMGFSIPENFNFPYVSRSITEFWQRWHMSLGNWMRNYLYIPLGGNRISVNRTYLNLWFVFIISGFWHGAGWNFILWGAFHGLFLVIERLFLAKYLKGAWSFVYTFFIANIGWVLFRNADLSVSWMLYKKMFSFEFLDAHVIDGRFIVILVIALCFSFAGIFKPFHELLQNDERFYLGRKLRLSGLYVLYLFLFILSSAYLLGQNFNPFIYFRF